MDLEQLKATGNTISEASVYWDILKNLLPLTLVGGVTAMATNFSRILKKYTWGERILTSVSVVGVGCVAAGVATLGLSLFLKQPTPELQIVASSVAGATGQKIFDVYGSRILGRFYTEAKDMNADVSQDAPSPGRTDGHGPRDGSGHAGRLS
jgi:hypothetical protein